MPSRAKLPRTSQKDDASASEALPTSALNPSLDSAPSFLEKSDRSIEAPIPHGERSNLQLYLQEIGKTPLLTIAEEVTLARRSVAVTKPPATT